MRIWLEAGLVARGGGAGSRRYLGRLAAGLVDAGEDVHVLAAPGASGIQAPVLPYLLPVRAVHAAWAASRLPVVTRVVRGERPDLVHAVEPVGIPPVPPGLPLAVTVHDATCLRPGNLCGGRLRMLVRRAWRTRAEWGVVLTPSAATRDEVVDLGLPRDRIRVTPLGVGRAFLGPIGDVEAVRRRVGLEEPNVVFVGPLSRKKGGDVLLGALRRARAEEPRLTLAVIGRRVDVPDDVRAAVRFLAPQSDEGVAALYAQAAAVVCPSRAEGFNLVLAEALATGAAVIASDLPVHREVGQGCAILVPAADADALAEAVVKAARARPTASEHRFRPPSWSDTVRLTLEAYRATVAD